jgi:hypothetical protein
MSYDPNLWRTATHTRTFSNDGAGALSLFTVTGDVVVRIIPICKTIVASAAGANVELGVSADTDAMLGSTLSTDIDADKVWIDASPDSQIEPESTSRDYIIANGDDVILTLDAQVDSGVIAFYCLWRPLSSGATVVAV